MKQSCATPRFTLAILAATAWLAGCGGGGDSAVSVDTKSTISASSVVAPDPSTAAADTLIGHTMAVIDYHGTAPDMTVIIGPLNAVVGDGVEFTGAFASGFATIDLSDTVIRITAESDQPFGYFEELRFFDANGTITRFASVSVDPATNYAGFNSSRIHVDGEFIDVNLTGLAGKRGEQIVLRVGFALP